ncbi:hypothetical protein VOLCADRAFT_121408 [Volvox carteri f. nagariensis]|uniref:TAFII55 protein conserved region domain-containing protein n=1 Tax=Volvox carteri f. nagariensis TaxID=3068 RepID=D8U9J1_VOLCA|nr:uncharacterized protein VOLCADRAFT_121408 [Volvox carteri f. nagariensis]EFJ43652.1 hypothetical protein VOLCADRAFT_121408 [Volvox carteri f. nagariensis]|eukprot:XP_002955352.1 hypothetical protein VOLCADRAFT_121408 [Volvox carteri f. nagariensis]
MAEGAGTEEQFVLRVLDEALADKLHRMLREEITAHGHIELNFSDNNQDGVLTVDGMPYPVKLLNLPTVVEAYKTYDDVNMVKINDVGQLLLVGPPGSSLPEGPESADGVTPPMRNARQRHFKTLPKVDPAEVTAAERDLLALLSGFAPGGMTITDVEEEFAVDEETGTGSWRPLKSK